MKFLKELLFIQKPIIKNVFDFIRQVIIPVLYLENIENRKFPNTLKYV